MHLAWIVAAVLLSTLAVPLATSFIPYLLFQTYARESVPRVPQDHVVASSRSIVAVTQSVLCMVSYLSIVPFLCGAPSSLHDNKTEADFQEFSTAVRVFLDQVVLQAPRLDVSADIVSLERAADVALDVDAALMLTQEGSRYMTGIGDVLALSQVRRISRQLSTSLPKVLAHIELAVARTVFMQGTVVAGLTLLDDIDVFRTYVPGIRPPCFNRIVTHMTDALLNSTRFTTEAVQDSLALSTALSAALAQFRANRKDVHGCATGPGALCEAISPLFRGDSILSSVISDLEALKEVLAEGVALPLPHGSSFPLPVVRVIVEAQQHVLQKQLLFLWWTRQAMENGRA
ncbi:hypothetical protein VTO73DRAFT_3868 [Trametes versicolor]